jgi:dTMP kinase
VAGFFIVLEGPEGSGKSTQAKRLAERFAASGREVVLTREPGGTAIGEQIRIILLDRNNYAMLPKTEALLLSAARAQHVGTVIRPALERGAVVICDRYRDSTLAYQGGARGLEMAELEAIQDFATDDLSPDFRILLDIPVEIGLQRRFSADGETNRLDEETLDFHRRVRTTFLALAARNPNGWIVVDANAGQDEVANRIETAVAARLGSGCQP